jgi:imidazole glycerol-phosphate synthase subunit HisH
MNNIVGVLDIGIGNVGSIINMLKRVGAVGLKVSNPIQLKDIEKLIIPGVGSFDEGITKIHTRFSIEALNSFVIDRKCPTLGICLGMQLLGNGSDEGSRAGLGYISGHCRRFLLPKDSRLRVPNMGWNEVLPKNDAILIPVGAEPQRYYFTHSYHFDCVDSSMIAASADFAGHYVAAIQKNNIFGVQFHPEKSHKFGIRLFQRFMAVSI